MNCSGSEVEGRRADLAPQQASALMLRRAPLGRRLGLLLIVAGVVVLYDVILPAEQGNNSCQVVREEHTHTHTEEEEDINSVMRLLLSLKDMSSLPGAQHIERPCG